MVSFESGAGAVFFPSFAAAENFCVQIDVLSSNDFVATIVLRDLLPNQEYEFRLAQSTQTLPTRTVKTFPSPGTPHRFTFSFGSCVLRLYPRVWGSMFGYTRMAGLNPDFFLQIGDQIYIDNPLFLGLDSYPAKYRDAISEGGYQEISNKIPSFHICASFFFFFFFFVLSLLKVFRPSILQTMIMKL